MVATQAQRAALYTNLAEQMGQEAAETLMDELPPGGWHQMATKEDLAGVELRLRTAFTEALAETNVKLAETDVKLAESHASLVASQAKLVESHAESHAKLVESQAALQVAMHQGFAEAAKERAEAAKERAEIVKAQARQLYVIVATIAAATVSIWIALFTTAPGG